MHDDKDTASGKRYMIGRLGFYLSLALWAGILLAYLSMLITPLQEELGRNLNSLARFGSALAWPFGVGLSVAGLVKDQNKAYASWGLALSLLPLALLTMTFFLTMRPSSP